MSPWWQGTDSPALGESSIDFEALRRRRNRRATASTLAALGARAVVLATSFIAIPLTIGYLGTERYGAFVAVTSLTSLLVFADLGLGNGLLNVVSDAFGRQDRALATKAISSAFFMLVGIALVIGAVMVVIQPTREFVSVFGLADQDLAGDVGTTALVMIGLFLVGLPLGVVERIRMAYQEGFINSIAAGIAGLLSLACLATAIALKASLPVLALATLAPQVVMLAANGLRLFWADRPWLLPRLAQADRGRAWQLARIGFLFLVLQLAVAVAFNSDVVVAAAMLGPSAAATYSVTLKFFMLAPVLLGLMLTALWPAYTEAIARGDIGWVRTTLRRSLLISILVSGVSSIALLIGGSWLIRIWTGEHVDPPMGLMLGAAAWAITSSASSAVAVLLNAASIVGFQVIVATVMAAVSIVASVVLANLVGLPGVVWGTVGAYIVFAAIPIAIYTPRLLANLEKGRVMGSASP